MCHIIWPHAGKFVVFPSHTFTIHFILHNVFSYRMGRNYLAQ